jgi:hypothetical protein
MSNLAFGTSHFINIKSAITYYENLGFSAYEVRDKLIEGEIHVGEPEAWDGHYLKVDEEGRFHQVPDKEYEEMVETIKSEARSWHDWVREENPNGYRLMQYEIGRMRINQRSWDSLMNTIEDNEANEALLKEANKAMDKRTIKILDWIYGAREVMLIINGVMLFGIVCYLIFDSMQ